MAGKEVLWTGHFEQMGEYYPVQFDDMQIGLNGQILGRGSDEVGQFSINGMLSRNGTIKFTKQYNGQHAVQYSGIVGNKVIKGKWSIPGTGTEPGDFEIQMDLEEWKGTYMLNGQRNSFEFNLNVDSHGVFGVDKDSQGVFVVRGLYNEQTYQVQFTKQYIGGEPYQFKGQMTNDGVYWIVRGQYKYSQAQGEFEIYREAPREQQDIGRDEMMGGGQQQNYNIQHQQQYTPPPVQQQVPPPIIYQQGYTPPQQPFNFKDPNAIPPQNPYQGGQLPHQQQNTGFGGIGMGLDMGIGIGKGIGKGIGMGVGMGMGMIKGIGMGIGIGETEQQQQPQQMYQQPAQYQTTIIINQQPQQQNSPQNNMGQMQNQQGMNGGYNQQQFSQQQLQGYFQPNELFGGSSQDINNIIGLLQRGRRFTGAQLVSYVPRVTFEQDLQRLIAACPQNLDQFSGGDLVNLLVVCEFPVTDVFIVDTLLPLVRNQLGNMEKAAILRNIADRNQQIRIQQMMG